MKTTLFAVAMALCMSIAAFAQGDFSLDDLSLVEDDNISLIEGEPSGKSDDSPRTADDIIESIEGTISGPDDGNTPMRNMVLNPGFETTSKDSSELPMAWTVFQDNTQVSLDDNNPHSGAYCLRAERGAISQALPIPYKPGIKYRLSFWARTSDREVTPGSKPLYGKVWLGYARWKGGHTGWQPSGQDLVQAYANVDQWAYYTKDFNLANTDDRKNKIVLFLSRIWGNDDSVVWFDDVSVTPLTIIQEEKPESPEEKALHEGIRELARGISEQIQALDDWPIQTGLRIDLLEFDIEDLNTQGIIDDSRFEDLHAKLDGLSQDIDLADEARKQGIEKIKTDMASHSMKEELTENDAKALKELDNQVRGGAGPMGRFAALRNEIETGASNVAAFVSEHRAELETKIQQITVKRTHEAEQEIRDARTGKGLEHLLSNLKSADARTRAAAALECGRVEPPEAVPLLIDLLKDPVYEVRRNAIFALSWMQAKRAVPPLIELTGPENDRWTRRRATQALGQIGDRSAVPVLIKLLADSDTAVRQNAIYSLGWLKDSKAIKPLMEHYKSTRAERNDNGAASAPQYFRGHILHALGHIGDTSVVPFLIDTLNNTNELTMTRRDAAFALGLLGARNARTHIEKIGNVDGGKDDLRDANAFRQTALFALGMLDAQHDTTPGLRQFPALSHYENFYWNECRFHRAVGRWECWKSLPENTSDMRRYTQDISVTDIYSFDHLPFNAEWNRAVFDDLTRATAESLDDMNTRGMRTNLGWHRIGGRGLNKIEIDQLLSYYGKFPAFAGIWKEEGTVRTLDTMRAEDFRAYLENKYSPDQLDSMGVDPANIDSYPYGYYHRGNPKDRFENPVFWAEGQEFRDDSILENLQELCEWLHGVRKRTRMMLYFSTCNLIRKGSGHIDGMKLYSGCSRILDLTGIEPSYCTLSYDNAVLAELARDGEDRPVGMEIYAYRSRSPGMYAAGIWLSALHAQQFYVWQWGRVFKYPGKGNMGGNYRYWKDGYWDELKKACNAMARTEEYLVGTVSPRQVALLVSKRTDVLRGAHTGEHLTHYFLNQIGIFQALCQEHVQAEPIWTDTLTPEKISRYNVAVLATAKTLTPEQEDMIREWVRNGGFLVTTGGTTHLDKWGRPRDNYGLADVFGVDRVEAVTRESGEKVVVNVDDPLLGSLKKGSKISLVTGQTYDRVKPSSGQVLAAWENGDPAVIRNSFGAGGCLFIASYFPGHHCGTVKASVFPLQRNFFPGVRELLAGAVTGGLAAVGVQPAFTAGNCPPNVEVAMRCQPDRKRLIIQLLDYDHGAGGAVSGVQMRVNVPGGKDVRIFNPKDDTPIEYKTDGNNAVFNVRDFDIHEMIVVEY